MSTWLDATGSTVTELGIALAVLLGFCIAGMLLKQQAFLRRRRNIPLVIGGWGTRGKSGSERKKAALLQALGAKFVSKSTGCEAMFIVGGGERPREYVLFRPFDKASIWEQTDVVRLGNDIGCDAFIWECMGLQADYVNILQRAWMQDDLSTLTNAYPDHEDIQGPSGRDVAESISNFVRPGGRVISGEEEMHAELVNTAVQRGSEFRRIDLEQADLICPDVIQRYPYSVHPRNLTLVTEMGAELGLSANMVLKEVAETIIPDLGVLKTYPQVQVHGREVYFSNGMSANERAGTLHNWRRLGLEDPGLDRETWVVGVVNNRGDRVPRSKVFAAMLVNDLSAHLWVGIGSNLSGLRSYIEEALDQQLDSWSVPRDRAELRQMLESHELQLRVLCRSSEELLQRVANTLGVELSQLMPSLSQSCDGQPVDEQSVDLNALLSAADAVRGSTCPLDTEERRWIHEEHRRWQSTCERRAALESCFQSKQGYDDWLIEQRQWYRSMFLERVLLVEEYGISGPQLVRHIARHLPPRCRSHWVGLQNIKGTGLDFAERWVRVGEIHSELNSWSPEGSEAFDRLWRVLSRYGPLEDFEQQLVEARVLTLEREGQVPPGSWERFADRVERAPQEYDSATPEVDPAGIEEPVADSKQPVYRWLSRVLLALPRLLKAALEPALDPFDAMLRSSRARRVMKDFASARISGRRAQELLKSTYRRQKGGWL